MPEKSISKTSEIASRISKNEDSYTCCCNGARKDVKKSSSGLNQKAGSATKQKSASMINQKGCTCIDNPYDSARNSEHFNRLLKEKDQNVSNRDVLIGMLQGQLKKLEDHYKRCLDDQQDMRSKYTGVVQEVGKLKLICQKLEEENKKLTSSPVDGAKMQQELQNYKGQAEKYRSEYEELMKKLLELENKSVQDKEQGLQQLVLQFTNIENILIEQNKKLDTFFTNEDKPSEGCIPSTCENLKQNLEELKSSNEQIRANLACLASDKGININSSIDDKCTNALCCFEDVEQAYTECKECLKSEKIDVCKLKTIIVRQCKDIEKLKEELDQKCQQLGEVVGQSKEKLEENGSLLNEHEKSVDQINTKYQAALKELDVLRETNTGLSDQVKVLQKSLEQRKEQSRLSITEKSKSDGYVQNLQNIVKQLEAKLEEKENEILNLKNTENNKSCDCPKVVDNSQSIVELKKENDTLQKEISAKDEMIKSLQAQVQHLENELDSVRDDIKEYNNQSVREVEQLMCICMDLDAKLKQTKEELGKQSTLDDVPIDMEKLIQANEALQKELTCQTCHAKGLSRELKTVKALQQDEKNKLSAENECLKSQLEEEQRSHLSEVEKLKNDLKEYENENSSLQEKIKDMTIVCTDGDNQDDDRIEALTKELEEVRSQSKDLADKLNMCTQEVETLRDSGTGCTALKTENSKLKAKIATLEQKLAELVDSEAQVNELKDANEKLKIKVDRLEKDLRSSKEKVTNVTDEGEGLDGDVKLQKQLSPIEEETAQQQSEPLSDCTCTPRRASNASDKISSAASKSRNDSIKPKSNSSEGSAINKQKSNVISKSKQDTLEGRISSGLKQNNDSLSSKTKQSTLATNDDAPIQGSVDPLKTKQSSVLAGNIVTDNANSASVSKTKNETLVKAKQNASNTVGNVVAALKPRNDNTQGCPCKPRKVSATLAENTPPASVKSKEATLTDTTEKEVHVLTAQVTILYDNQQFQNGEESDLSAKDSTDCHPCITSNNENAKLKRLQTRLDTISQMEKQVESMILSIKEQNEKLVSTSTVRMRQVERITQASHQTIEPDGCPNKDKCKAKREITGSRQKISSKGSLSTQTGKSTPKRSFDGNVVRQCNKCPHSSSGKPCS